MMSTKDIVKTRFSELASEWAATYSDPGPRGQSAKNLLTRQRFALQMVAAGLPHGAKILDVGCGPGETAANLMQRGYEVWGMDIAEPMIRHAKERCGVDRFRLGDVEQIPFPDGTFDGVVCLGVLEYVDAQSRALSEIGRVLKPGGRAVLATPSGISPLYLMDRVVAAAELVYAFAKYRLRGKRAPARAAVAYRRYYRGSWIRLLRSQGLEPEDWVCYGWGWYQSRLGVLVKFLSKIAEHLRTALERVLGRSRLQRVGDRLVRSRAFNWLASEQLVRLRVAK